MRTFLFGLLAVLFSTAAMASQTYVCEATGPKGRVKIVVPNYISTHEEIYFSFYNYALNQTYEGAVTVLGTDLGADKHQFVIGGKIAIFGDLNPSDITLFGTLDPFSLVINSLVIHARTGDGKTDHRIETGYGNFIGCQLQ